MNERSGISKLAGRLGGLAGLVGVILFMVGLFGPVRNVVFVGLALIITSLAAYCFEEFGPRQKA